MAMLFSNKKWMPAVLKPVPGSVRDPKVFRSFMYPLMKCVVIADRGSSPGSMEKSGAGYIMPLKSNSTVADYSLGIKKSFSFKGGGDQCLQEEDKRRNPVHVRRHNAQV